MYINYFECYIYIYIVYMYIYIYISFCKCIYACCTRTQAGASEVSDPDLSPPLAGCELI